MKDITKDQNYTPMFEIGNSKKVTNYPYAEVFATNMKWVDSEYKIYLQRGTPIMVYIYRVALQSWCIFAWKFM